MSYLLIILGKRFKKSIMQKLPNLSKTRGSALGARDRAFDEIENYLFLEILDYNVGTSAFVVRRADKALCVKYCAGLRHIFP